MKSPFPVSHELPEKRFDWESSAESHRLYLFFGNVEIKLRSATQLQHPRKTTGRLMASKGYD